MSEVLSQSEIDDLLRSLLSGEINSEKIKAESGRKKVKPYDFRSSNKFTKEQIRTFHVIYENYAHLLSTYFSGILRAYCRVEVVSVEEQTYGEFSNSLSDPVILGIAELSPLQGSTLVEMAPAVVSGIIDCLLGGPGKQMESVKGFTDIELAITERVMKQMMGFLKESWANMLSIDPAVQRIETSSRFTQIMSHNETIIIITMDIKVKDISGMINFCIPYFVLEPVIKQFNTRYWFSTKADGTQGGSYREEILARIENTPLEMRGTLGETILTLQEVMDLQVGDVIQLDQRVSNQVKVKIQNMTRFHGTLGERKQRLAIRINKVLKDEVMEDE